MYICVCVWYIDTIEFYSAEKKNEVMKISEKWMGLEKNYIKQDDPDSERYQPCLLVHMIMAILVVCVYMCL